MLCQTGILHFWIAVSDFRNIEKTRNLCKIQITTIFQGASGEGLAAFTASAAFATIPLDAACPASPCRALARGCGFTSTGALRGFM